MSLAAGREQDAIDLLAQANALTNERASEALRLATLWGTGPIDAVLSIGMAPADRVAEALAQAAGVSLLDPLRDPVDARAAEQAHLKTFVRGGFLPWRKSDGAILLAVVNPYTAQREIEAWLGTDTRFSMTVTTQSALTEALLEVFGHAIVEKAIYGLSDAAPEMSARRGITWQQTIVFLGMIGLTSLAFVRAPETSFTVASLVAGAFFIAIMIFRLILMIASLTRPPERAPPSEPRTSPAELPVYTILVALRDEAALLPQITRALGALDYPATKLDILLLLEASDERTRAASRSLALDGRFRALTVPDRLPRTKPKACNFGLAFARGDYVTVYDAEDRPDPEQLLAALAAFARRPETGCMQARLSFYNAAENWLTRQFALEFTLWFSLLLPGLARLGLPIPLGGTSNHFRRELLEAAHGWDAFNVTEDADIGIRLARAGTRVRTVASTTSEEANCELANWLHQRSRWLKGYLQTWVVHMRAPKRLAHELGFFGFWSFQLLIGGAVLSALLHLAFWAVLIIQIAQAGLTGISWTGALLTWTLTVLIVGNGLAIVSGMIAALQPQLKGQGRLDLLLSALSMPLYWFLISFAAIKALVSFASRPFYWAKTRHGLSRLAPSFEQTDQAGRALKRARSGQA